MVECLVWDQDVASSILVVPMSITVPVSYQDPPTSYLRPTALEGPSLRSCSYIFLW